MLCVLVIIIVEQVHSFKLLGVTTDNDLKWSTHVNTICSKASSRLHFLKVLKRCSLSTSDLLYFYTSAVRPLLEYACPAWHTSLTSEQSKQIERIQIRALKIIVNTNCIDYENSCLIHNLDTLSNRRNQLCMCDFLWKECIGQVWLFVLSAATATRCVWQTSTSVQILFTSNKDCTF